MKHFLIKSEPMTPCQDRHSLDRRTDPEYLPEYSPEWETKTAISAILDITLKSLSFRQQLRAILDLLVESGS